MSSSSSPQRALPPLNHPISKDTLLRKSFTYLLISLILCWPTLFLTFDWLWEPTRLPTCGNPANFFSFCTLVPLPPILSFATFIFNYIALLEIDKWMRAHRPNPVLNSNSTIHANSTDNHVDEVTPLLVGVLPQSSVEGREGPTFRLSITISTWILTMLWMVCLINALANLAIMIAPGSNWDTSMAGAVCLLVSFPLLQVWMLSIVALACGRTTRIQGDIPRASIPEVMIQANLFLSLALLLGSAIITEGHLPLLRLFFVTIIFDFVIIFGNDIYQTLLLRSCPATTFTPKIHDGGLGPTSRLPRRIFFVTVFLCTVSLAVLWIGWSLATFAAATLRFLRDVRPGWGSIRLPIPERSCSVWVWLEGVIATGQGWTLGNAALNSWRARYND